MERPESSLQGQKRVRGKNNSVTSRRIWQKREEDELMKVMLDLISNKWRNENGQFKPGFYPKVEEKLKIVFPETDLCASPHIESKVKLWKKHYYALLGMLNTSGFGWNDTDKMISVDSDDVWKNYLKKDLSVSGMRNKSFPYYDNWCHLFGKDRATGELAEGPEEAVAAMNEEEIQMSENPFVAPLPADVDFSANGTTPMQSGSCSGRKRSRNDAFSSSFASMGEQFANMFESTKLTMAEIAQRIGYDQDLSESRKKVNGELKKLPLETKYRLKAASMIVGDAARVDLFFSLSEEDRLEWVYMLLAGGI